MTRLPFKTGQRSKRVLEIIHSVLCGSIDTETCDAERYMLTFIDDFWAFVMVFLLDRKHEVIHYFKEYKEKTEAKFNLNANLDAIM